MLLSQRARPVECLPKEKNVMEFKELLTKRYATKLFQPQAVPEETMQELLEMVRLAPSGLNVQPWRIKVVRDAETKAKLSPATHDEAQINSCSHLLVFCADTDWAALTQRLGRVMKERTVPDMIWAKVMGIADEMAQEPEPDLRAWIIGQAFIAATYGLLGAQALGLDCCPMTHFDPGEYSRILGLPENIVPVVLLPVGYAADEARPKWRYPLGDILI
jgi:nitroreductase/dihydropteridine reductase